MNMKYILEPRTNFDKKNSLRLIAGKYWDLGRMDNWALFLLAVLTLRHQLSQTE